MHRFQTYLADDDATAALGAALATTLVPGLRIYLHGDLGAGKTALVRALLHAAGHAGRVKSPTYTLAEPYTIRIDGQPAEAMHFDLYRMGSAEEFIDAGFRDDVDAGKVCLVEWPEKGEGVLPLPDIDLFLDVEGAGRRLELAARSARGEQCLTRLQFPSDSASSPPAHS